MILSYLAWGARNFICRKSVWVGESIYLGIGVTKAPVILSTLGIFQMVIIRFRVSMCVQIITRVDTRIRDYVRPGAPNGRTFNAWRTIRIKIRNW